jgi:C1A family cysteine protease
MGKDGKMSMPWKFEPKMGGHAVMAVGYDDEQQHLIVRNSWGDTWGDKGYFYMPYKFAADKSKAMEFYTAE